jgi:hypothetical protein
MVMHFEDYMAHVWAYRNYWQRLALEYGAKYGDPEAYNGGVPGRYAIRLSD